ncbi:hypothetical protein NP233_g7956 [Leucocoprinus birnbaumii]|uniref:Uncharacterized protein n=1 Tax=Leucocoprinus birnbaumii TaxID=56174 RepID=A0AAD5VNC1_9AGAR|nr:hypothetical protein NP233_g7956 [Leucocoprinus birnbaumii]
MISDPELPCCPPSTSINGPDSNSPLNRLARLRTKPLTPKQERRLVTYLDEEFLKLTRGYKKRASPSTHVPTLHAYITEARKLLSFILQIPPVNPSTELRTQFLLRLTGDCLSAIVGYVLVPPRRQRFDTPVNAGRTEENGGMEAENESQHDTERRGVEEDEEPRDYTSALREMLDWLDDLDQAWVASATITGRGILKLGRALTWSSQLARPQPTASTRMGLARTQMAKCITDVTRLRSLLVTSIANLEDWLSHTKPRPSSTVSETRNGISDPGGEADVASMLERLGLLDEFDDLFSRTMDFLGGFTGGNAFIVEPETIVQDGVMRGEGDMDDEDMSDMVEVVMTGCS